MSTTAPTAPTDPATVEVVEVIRSVTPVQYQAHRLAEEAQLRRVSELLAFASWLCAEKNLRSLSAERVPALIESFLAATAGAGK